MSRSVSKKRVVSKKKKIISGVILGVGAISMVAVIIMAICGVFDTGKVKPIRSSFADSRSVGKIEGNKVRYEELKYVTFVLKEQYRERYGEDIWDSEESAAKYRDQLEADVILALKEIYATLVICDEVGVKKNNSEVKEAVQAQIEAMVASNFGGSFDEYKAYLERNNLTDAFNRFKTKTYFLDEQAMAKMVADGDERIKYTRDNAQEFIDYVLEEDDFYRSIHVYFEKTGDATVDKAKYDEAMAMVEELNSISDTDERYKKMKEYIGNGEFRPGYITETAAGFYVTDGVMGDEYDAAARSVDVYGVALAETEYDYFVVMRMPKEKEHVQSQFETILTYYHGKVYFDYKNEVIGRISFEGNKYYDGLDIVDIVD